MPNREIRLAKGLFDITPLEPLASAGYTVLTPNLRLSRRIRSEWDAARRAAGQGAWDTLPAQPVRQWLMDQWRQAVRLGLLPPLVPLSASQELLLWRQVIEEHSQRSGDYNLLRSASAAELASEAAATLDFWQVELTPALRQQFRLETDCETFVSWLDAFEARLVSDQFATTCQCLRALATVSDQMPKADLVLVACDDLSPLEAHLVHSLAGDLRAAPTSGEMADISVTGFTEPRAELLAVARWAARLRNDDPGCTIGVVLAGGSDQQVALEYLLRREFDCLGENYTSLPVNFSSGISLSQAPVVRDALAVLDFSGRQVDVEAVFGLFRSRFLDLPDRDSPLAQHFLRELSNGGSARLDVGELRNFAGKVSLDEAQGLFLGQRLLALANRRELRRAALPSQWANRFGDVLSEWGWPGHDLDSLEYQQVKRWYQTLDEFRALDGVSGEVACSDALSLLRDTCNRQVSHPQTADSPVQVLGPLEAVGLSFNHLWLCGLQASNWPAPARPNPFIPMSLQALRKMPHSTAEREWEFSLGLLGAYRSACGAVHASYSHQVDGIPELPSPLLAGFEERASEEIELLDPVWRAAAASATLHGVQDNRVAAGDEELAGVRGGSALVEHQSQCPFSAFARHRLRVEPLGESVQGLSAAERGSLVHWALRHLWSLIPDHAALCGLDEQARAARVAAACAEAMGRLAGFRKRAVGQACLELEQDYLAALLLEWLALEEQRAAFAIEALEQRVELQVGALRVRLQVDRMDRLPDGSLVIIDYKTGTAKVQDWFGERPAKPQLLLYGLASDSLPGALAFATVRPGESAFVGLGEVGGIPGVDSKLPKAVAEALGDGAGWEAVNEAWRLHLERLAGEFVHGHAEVAPLNSNSCTYCGLQPLCRVGIDTDQAEVIDD